MVIIMVLTDDLLTIKNQIDPYVGSKVRVRANKGRKRIVVNEGILENTYPSIFVVKVRNELSNNYRHLSFSYADILTHTVELSLCE